MKHFTRAVHRRTFVGGNPKRAERGSALVATLCTISVGSLMAAGVATASFSSYSRTLADQNSAKALDMAECAAQYQMQRIVATLDQAPVVYNGSNLETATYGSKASPIPVSGKLVTSGTTNTYLYGLLSTSNATSSPLNGYMGMNGTRADGNGDYAIAWIEYPSSSTRAFTTDSQDDVYVYGEARIGNVWRRVRCTAGSGCLFDKWGCYGHTCIKSSGTLTCGPTSGSNPGCIASNGQISVKSGSTCGQQKIFGSCTPEPTIPYTWGGNSCDVPTCHTTACSAHTCGGYYVSPNASTSTCGIRRFQGTVNNSSCNDNYSCGRVYAGNGYTVPMSGTGNQGSYQYNTCYLKGKGTNSCANIYMKGCQGYNRTIYCDTTNGPVNLWIDSDDADGDTLTGGCDIAAYDSVDRYGNPNCTQSAARLFHVFYYNSNNCPLTFNLNNNTTRRVCGMVHCFNKDKDSNGNDVPTGNIVVNGAGVSVTGAMNGNQITGSGNISITYAPRGSNEDTSGSYFERRGGFQEVLPSRGN